MYETLYLNPFQFFIKSLIFTPLKIYNGTALAVQLEIHGQPLPINELNGMPPKEACPISNLHRCIFLCNDKV